MNQTVLKYLFYFLTLATFYSCNGGSNPVNSSVQDHEQIVLDFWKSQSPEILDFILKYEALNKHWTEELDKSPTKVNTVSTIDTIVKEAELVALEALLESSGLMFYQIHVGAKNGYSSAIIFPKKYAQSNYENHLEGLTYSVNEFHRKDIHIDLSAFNDPNIKTETQANYNSIKLDIFSSFGSSEIYFRLKKASK